MKHISLEQNGMVAEVIMHREPVNALDEELVSELADAFRKIDQDPHSRVLIIRSALPVFAAGADIKMMKSLRDQSDHNRMLGYVRKMQQTYNLLETLSKPTIAYISGHAMGGGFELALACDFRFMTSGKARVGLPEVKLGLIPGAGGTQRLTRLIGEAAAKELIYNARTLSAEEAFRYGVVSRVVQADTGMDEVYQYARELAKRAPLAIAGAKRCIQAAGQCCLSEGLEREITASAIAFASEDAKEGFDAFLNKREPVFSGR